MRQIEGCLDSMGPTLAGDIQVLMRYWSWSASERVSPLHPRWHSRWARMVRSGRSRSRGSISSPATPPPVKSPPNTEKPQKGGINVCMCLFMWGGEKDTYSHKVLHVFHEFNIYASILANCTVQCTMCTMGSSILL